MLYVNGAAGNLAPIYTTQRDLRSSHIGEFRVLLGDKILEAARAMPPGASATLWLAEKFLESPRKSGLGWPSDLPAYAGKAADGADTVRIPVRFLKIGDTVLWGSPVELFCEIAMRIRNESPFRHTFFLGYTNGWLGLSAYRGGVSAGRLRATDIAVHRTRREGFWRRCCHVCDWNSPLTECCIEQDDSARRRPAENLNGPREAERLSSAAARVLRPLGQPPTLEPGGRSSERVMQPGLEDPRIAGAGNPNERCSWRRRGCSDSPRSRR